MLAQLAGLFAEEPQMPCATLRILFLNGECCVLQNGVAQPHESYVDAISRALAAARQLVRWIAAKRNEVGHLPRFDAIALAYFRGPDARHFASAHRLQDRRRRRGELKDVAVAARHDGGSAAPLLGRDGGGEKVIGLV